jgi:hypothetical protein
VGGITDERAAAGQELEQRQVMGRFGREWSMLRFAGSEADSGLSPTSDEKAFVGELRDAQYSTECIVSWCKERWRVLRSSPNVYINHDTNT